MDLNRFALYKVVEIERGIAMINALDKSDRPEAVTLITATMDTCIAYLQRYVHARGNGKSMREAHTEALYGLRAVQSWDAQ